MRSPLIGECFDYIFVDNLRDYGSHKFGVLAYSQDRLIDISKRVFRYTL